MKTKDYFESEMRLLHESGKDFANTYPHLGRMLNIHDIRDRDPHVERLLEGVAYLTGQVKQKIDDDFPEVCETLLEQMWPHMLRPFPSATIIEFQANHNQLQQTKLIPKNTQVSSGPISDEKIKCQFTTVAEVAVNPIEIVGFQVKAAADGGAIFRFCFSLFPGSEISTLDLNRIRLHFHADMNVSLYLFWSLVSEVISIKVSEGDQSAAVILGGQELITPSFIGGEESLSPGVGREFHHYHLLHDLFSFREKFLFVDLLSLSDVIQSFEKDNFYIEVHTRAEVPKEMLLQKENFKLHCVPAINLFPCISEPVTVTHQKEKYPLVCDVKSRAGVAFHSIVKVEGMNVKTGETLGYHMFQSFRQRESQEQYFQIIRGDNVNDSSVSISVGGQKNFHPEVLSCEVMATNANYPNKFLSDGDIKYSSAEFPVEVSIRNVSRPTVQLSSPKKSTFSWALISHMSLNYQSLTELNKFKEILICYDWSDHADNKRRISAIESLKVSPIERIIRGVFIRGLSFYFHINESGFHSHADIYQFSLVIHQFLSMHRSVNSLVETRIVTHPSGKEIIWDPIVKNI